MLSCNTSAVGPTLNGFVPKATSGAWIGTCVFPQTAMPIVGERWGAPSIRLPSSRNNSVKGRALNSVTTPKFPRSPVTVSSLRTWITRPPVSTAVAPKRILGSPHVHEKPKYSSRKAMCGARSPRRAYPVSCSLAFIFCLVLVRVFRCSLPTSLLEKTHVRRHSVLQSWWLIVLGYWDAT